MTPSPQISSNPSAAEARQPRLWTLIPCAGSGSRAGVDAPKQYQMVAGRPMVAHTLAAFASVARVHRTLLVLAGGDNFLSDHPEVTHPASRVTPVLIAPCGGPTRAASVLNGLNVLLQQGADAKDWVLVHDAARCLITPELINKLIDACEQDAVGGLLAQPLPDTLKMGMTGRVAATLDRSDKWLAQTPQMFRIGLLREALVMTGERVTDESSAIEAMGLSPKLVPGSAQNFKVTYPEDFALAQAVLQARLRTGNPAVARLNQGNSDYDYP
ncbi:MAG TPA: 2-C-methyl-D-erythritol 4-phosphate cytidylyltransferase [Burkholderiaceae bacterium]|nr:2-C-methyl-D-erythritol 4-phosphate cytidylyltransferase [Burkholderiaceae bacterium]